MIRINSIHIEEFRGIRNLDLDLDAKNFGICGPNGTGKSGIVDAIEFCLTGDVTRLSGQGTTGLSVKNHAPHVEQRNSPEKANVTISAKIPSINKAVQIHRSVKNPRNIKILPDDADVVSIIEELQSHPEFALSRREIVKYIITPPGKRSEDVQTLLRLEYLEKLRKSLTTFNNKCKIRMEEAERNEKRARNELRITLETDKLDKETILKKVNENRKILDLEILTDLTKNTSFKEGLVAQKKEEKKPTIRKTIALADLSSLKSTIEKKAPDVLIKNQQKAKATLETLRDDENALILAKRFHFIKTGCDFITENACPLCDKEWDADELREYLNKKLLTAKKTKQLLENIRGNINTVLNSLSERVQAIETTIKYCNKLKPQIETTELDAYLRKLKSTEIALKDFLEDYNQFEQALEAVTFTWWSPTKEQQTSVNKCHKAVKALPDISAEDDARDKLTVAQERYDRFYDFFITAKKEKSQSSIAQRILEHYHKSNETVLEGIYNNVAKDFSTFYSTINRQDEEKFVGKLTSAPAKLSFDVDFYEYGLFPPGAYHSEGHQDGMGLCLYLALMKHTLGNKFTFAVLDDVLMSIDSGHRREVCRLLKSEFPNTQFIITTHDRVWLQYMKTEGLVNNSKSFGGWHVKTGPRVWDDHDIWTEIQNELGKDDVAKAAGLLRRFLEYTSIILADNLRAPIEFKGDGNYGLGDLMPHVLKVWRKRLEDGEKSAIFWKQDKERKILAEKRVIAKELIAKTNAEQWAINPSIHYNEWANFQRHEFQEVVDVFKQLLENLQCKNKECNSYIYVLPQKGKAEEMRCNCGATNINLKTDK